MLWGLPGTENRRVDQGVRNMTVLHLADDPLPLEIQL